MDSKADEGSTPYHHGDLRRALLEAAEAELSEKGVEGFSLRGCAKRAGVSHAAPAHHFGDAAGLLSALTAEGFRRFVETVERRKAPAKADPHAALVAAGLGYVEFALGNPALFRLMFTSTRPDRDDEELALAARAAFEQLLGIVAPVDGETDPMESEKGRHDVAALWSVVHGLSELLLSGRLTFISALPPKQREAAVASILTRVAVPREG